MAKAGTPSLDPELLSLGVSPERVQVTARRKSATFDPRRHRGKALSIAGNHLVHRQGTWEAQLALLGASARISEGGSLSQTEEEDQTSSVFLSIHGGLSVPSLPQLSPVHGRRPSESSPVGKGARELVQESLQERKRSTTAVPANSLYVLGSERKLSPREVPSGPQSARPSLDALIRKRPSYKTPSPDVHSATGALSSSTSLEIEIRTTDGPVDTLPSPSRTPTPSQLTVPRSLVSQVKWPSIEELSRPPSSDVLSPSSSEASPRPQARSAAAKAAVAARAAAARALPEPPKLRWFPRAEQHQQVPVVVPDFTALAVRVPQEQPLTEEAEEESQMKSAGSGEDLQRLREALRQTEDVVALLKPEVVAAKHTHILGATASQAFLRQSLIRREKEVVRLRRQIVALEESLAKVERQERVRALWTDRGRSGSPRTRSPRTRRPAVVQSARGPPKNRHITIISDEAAGGFLAKHRPRYPGVAKTTAAGGVRSDVRIKGCGVEARLWSWEPRDLLGQAAVVTAAAEQIIPEVPALPPGAAAARAEDPWARRMMAMMEAVGPCEIKEVSAAEEEFAAASALWTAMGIPGELGRRLRLLEPLEPHGPLESEEEGWSLLTQMET